MFHVHGKGDRIDIKVERGMEQKGLNGMRDVREKEGIWEEITNTKGLLKSLMQTCYFRTLYTYIYMTLNVVTP